MSKTEAQRSLPARPDLGIFISGKIGERRSTFERATASGRFAASCPPDKMRRETGGACRDRTDDLKLAKLALSQLS